MLTDEEFSNVGAMARLDGRSLITDTLAPGSRESGDGGKAAATPAMQTVAIVATLDIDCSISGMQYHGLTDGLFIGHCLSGLTSTVATQGGIGSTA